MRSAVFSSIQSSPNDCLRPNKTGPATLCDRGDGEGRAKNSGGDEDGAFHTPPVFSGSGERGGLAGRCVRVCACDAGRCVCRRAERGLTRGRPVI